MFGADERGSSLIEVMISMTLLSVGMLGLVGLQVSSANGNRFGGRMQQATLLAEERAASLAALAFEDNRLSDSNTSNNPPKPGARFALADENTQDPTSVSERCDPMLDIYARPTAISVAAGDSGFQRCWQIADESWNASISGADSKRIRVFVRFRDPDGTLWHETSVTTLKTVVLR